MKATKLKDRETMEDEVANYSEQNFSQIRWRNKTLTVEKFAGELRRCRSHSIAIHHTCRGDVYMAETHACLLYMSGGSIALISSRSSTSHRLHLLKPTPFVTQRE